MLHYRDIRDKLKTGDIVLFSGQDPISRVIRGISQSTWSHVGMVVIWEEMKTVLIWESTPVAKAKDIESNQHQSGVNLIPLSHRINTWLARDPENLVAVRHLDQPLDDAMQSALLLVRSELKGRGYAGSLREILNAAIDRGGWSDNSEDLSTLFCSELVAEAYQRMGLLPDHKPSNEYTPRDFSCEQTDSFQFPMRHRRLGDEILITIG